MPRPPMPPGTWGTIGVYRTAAGTHEASANYVYFSGRVARIRARAASAQAARTALVRKLQELNGAEASEDDLTPLTTVAGWWSPTATTTRSSSPKVSTNEIRALNVYWIASR